MEEILGTNDSGWLFIELKGCEPVNCSMPEIILSDSAEFCEFAKTAGRQSLKDNDL